MATSQPGFTTQARALRALAPLALLLASCGGGGGGGSIPPFDIFESVAGADLDGDGLPDIAAAFTPIAGPPPHPGYVAVYRQLPGRPVSFAAPQRRQLSTRSSPVRASRRPSTRARARPT